MNNRKFCQKKKKKIVTDYIVVGNGDDGETSRLSIERFSSTILKFRFRCFFVVEWCDQFHCRGHYHVCPTHTHTYTFDDSFSTSFNWIVYNLFSRSGSSSSQTQWMNSDCLFWTVCIYECVCVCVSVCVCIIRNAWIILDDRIYTMTNQNYRQFDPWYGERKKNFVALYLALSFCLFNSFSYLVRFI